MTTMPRPLLRRIACLCVVVAAGAIPGAAQERTLGREDILLLGVGMRVEPATQVVPRDIATIVSTFLQAETPPSGLPAFAPDAVVKGTLRGPEVPLGRELVTTPNTPFAIPPLTVAGIYTLDDIRLESGGQILMRGTPESVTIQVIDKLLVTQVTARALTAQEIRDKGIVFDKSSFQAYNFTAAFAIEDNPVRINFPVVLPTLQAPQDTTVGSADLAAIGAVSLPTLKTIIPDTLRLQTRIPNLQVVGFTLSVANLQGQTLVVPPIPGVVIIPGDIGFLNQFFSVMLMVGNVAPAGSNLTVEDLRGSILLPAGVDTVSGSDDDPLRMARSAEGESPRVRLVAQAGADGRLGTGDDVLTLAPGESGSAEYLVEGRREGTHVIEFALAGTLRGLPGGPVSITGRAAGSVLVRNPAFSLTFTHPEVVSAGEPYTLDVTVTNTSESPANFVSVNLYARNVAGAAVVGDAGRSIDSIPPGDSATVSFDLIARTTGRVTAATLDSDANVAGQFSLKTSVGELGVPVSPDSLILPKEANGLPAALRTASLGLLGKAWAVATAPAAALPKNVARMSKQIVLDRAVQVAEAGFRIQLHEPVPDSAAQLAFDFIGSDYNRLASRYSDPADLAFARADAAAFDALRRQSLRGDTFAAAVGAVLGPQIRAADAATFHRTLGGNVITRPPHLSIVTTTRAGVAPYSISLVDASGRRVGRTDAAGKVVKTIPFGDVVPLSDNGQRIGEAIVLVAPEPGEYHLQFDPVPGADPASPFDVSLVVPDGNGGLRQVAFAGLTGDGGAASPFAATDPYRVLLDLPVSGAPSVVRLPASDGPIVPPPPRVLSAVQQAEADIASCTTTLVLDGTPEAATLRAQLGRIVAVLFSTEVTPEAVQDRLAASGITRYLVDGNAVVGVALQPGRRIAFLGLRNAVGPFVPRQITIAGVTDAAGRVMEPQTLPIEATVTDSAAVVTGQVLSAEGQPLPFADVRMFMQFCGATVGLGSSVADAAGRFAFDWIRGGTVNRASVSDPATGDGRKVDFTIQRDGQRLNVNVALLGRGTLRGRTLGEDGRPLAGTSLRVTSLTDDSSYGATSDADGQYAVSRVPAGNVFIEAVNTAARAKVTASDVIPIGGAITIRDLTLLSQDAPRVVVQTGTVVGHVLRGAGGAPVADAPVVVYYRNESQTGVKCPGNPAPAECAIDLARTGTDGAFRFAGLAAGQLRLSTFEQATLQQGEARITLGADATAEATILFALGLGIVDGTVVDGSGVPVADARVGGGLSLTVTDAAGHFRLTDVPVGHRDIVAVSDALATTGAAAIDLLQAGQVVNATIVLQGTGAVAGTVFAADGVTPQANIKVYLFHAIETADGAGISVDASAVTDAGGRYTLPAVPLGNSYTLSAFRSDFADGNVKPIVLKFNHEVVRGDIVFRGGGGHIRGAVYDADGHTPLRAAVGLSGDQVVVAGGLVGTAFQRVTNYRVTNTDFTSGEFGFDGLFVGPFTLAAAGQFSPDPITFAGTIPAAGATVRVDLRLQATSQIAGTVLQADGVTPVGANVLVRYTSKAFKVVCAQSSSVRVGGLTIDPGSCQDVPQGIQDETVITDDQGRFLLPLVNAGSFTLSAEDRATGAVGQVGGEVAPGQTADLPLRLMRLRTLVVRVKGSDAVTPIPGARVEVAQPEFPRKRVTALADAGGVLRLEGGDAFSEGDVAILATDLRTGFAGRATARVTNADGDVTVDVFLYNASGSVAGRVFKSDGLTPVANAEVVISNDRGPLVLGITDASGDYRADLIPLGPFAIDVFEAATARRGRASGRIDFDRQVVPVNIAEVGRGLVTGTVLESGTLGPLRGWDVSLDPAVFTGRIVPPLRTTSGVDGTFSFPGAPVGDFRIHVGKLFAPGEPIGFADSAGRLPGEGQRIDLPVVVELQRRRAGRLEGTVFNPDGTPAPNIAVDVCASDCFEAYNRLSTLSDAQGGFAFDSVAVGRYTLRAQSQTSRNAAVLYGNLAFEGDISRVRLTLVGVSTIGGQVVLGDGRPAAGAQLTLRGQPASGCSDARGFDICTGFADADGRFTFINVPARTYTVTAVDPVSGLKGVASGSVNPGQALDLRIALEPTAAVAGRVLQPDGSPATGVTIEIALRPVPAPGQPDRHFFQVSDAAGAFAFDAVPLGTYEVRLEDPLSTGIARTALVLTAAASLGDIVLDAAPPSVVASDPLASAVQVPRNQAIRLTFSEPLAAGSVTPANVALGGPAGPVPATLALSDGDRVVTVTPLDPLRDQTRYTLSVQGVQDRLGHALSPAYVASFTTVDILAPQILETSPAQGAGGAPKTTVVRVKFSEPFDTARFRGPPIRLLSGGVDTAGRTDVVFGNTTLVFTPLLPLQPGADYEVQVAAAADAFGNSQPQGLTYRFRTTDGTAPVILALTPSNGGRVIENAVAQVTPTLGPGHDISVIDYFVNDQPAGAVRTAPFTFSLQAVPALGKAGDSIRISASATDTSGSRSTQSAQVVLAIVPDTPPTIRILSPAAGASFHNGDRVGVTVQVTDDLGATQVGYRAQTGRPQDAATRLLTPPATDRTETFFFTVAADALPGAAIQIQASGVDSRGQIATAVPVSIAVLDATPPTVVITGTTTGTRVVPGQQTSAVVSAQDLGGVRSITFTAGGAAVRTETRLIDPALPAAVAAFAFTVPPTARAGDTVTLDAVATDAAGNSTAAARLLLPVADLNPPTLRLRTASGSTTIVPGSTVTVIAEADDESAVANITLAGQGAFTVADARQVTPPSNAAHVEFAVTVPPGAATGSVLTLAAVATDIFGNASLPATLALTVNTVTEVTLPPSLLIAAGEQAEIVATLSAPAPAGGLRLDFASGQPEIARADASVLVPEGDLTAALQINGVAGGTTTVTALVAGVPRGAITVVVRGGVVAGVVLSPALVPVAGAVVTVSEGAFGGGRFQTAVTDAAGHYGVEGIDDSGGVDFVVQVRDPLTQLIGYARGRLSGAHGFARQDVVLLPAGAISGVVYLSGGTTPAGTGARVDIFDVRDLSAPLDTVFTGADGGYEFPLVTLGSYVLVASDPGGNRGRPPVVALIATGQQARADIIFLGRGVVTGRILSGSGVPLPNIPVTVTATSLFGAAPDVQTTADGNGVYRVEGVFVGNVAVLAHEQGTNLAGVASGALESHGQVLTLDVHMAASVTVQGTIFRADGVTPVALAGVSLTVAGASLTTQADAQGRYALGFVPLGVYSIEARETGTRAFGRASGTLAAGASAVTLDVVLFAQGSVQVLVTDAGGVPLPGAAVTVSATNGQGGDSLAGVTGADGTVLLLNVLAGNLSVSARANGLSGGLYSTLSAGEVKRITLALEPTASIAGVVRRPDGQTPADDATVALCDQCARTPVGADGSYRFDGIRVPGSATVVAFDAQGRKRGLARNVSLTTNGQVAAGDITMVGIGSITGRVINPDLSSASGVVVLVRGLNPDFGSYNGPTSDAAGFYRVDGVAVGQAIASAGDAVRGLLGESTGSLTRDGDTLNLDILLRNNAVTLPVTVKDGNVMPYEIQRDGSVRSGLNGVYVGYYGGPTSGFVLDLVSQGASYPFTGATIGTTEQDGREVVVAQNGVAGLNVTRKILVSSAYFARYLEILSNPTAAPITVDVRVRSNVRANAVLATSSGDAIASVSDPDHSDRWLLLDSGFDVDPFSGQYSNGLPQAGFVFDGPGAQARLGALTVDGPPYGGPQQVAYSWNGVTLQPGETVAFMHAGFQQYNRAAARASAERLLQLPPELLEGLSPAEIAAVRNFAIPAEGTSPVPPLPRLDGTITGRVLEADGVTPISSVSTYGFSQNVRFRSSNIFFGRTYTTGATAAGNFSFGPADASHFVAAVTVPVDGFVLEAIHPATNLTSSATVGSFAAGTATANADIVFSNTAILRGFVRRHTGTPVAGATVNVTTPEFNKTSLPSQADGSYSFSGLPAGTATVTASIPHPQSSRVRLRGSTTLTLLPGVVRPLDLSIQPTGLVSGVVRTASGAVATNVGVSLLNADPIDTFATIDTRTDSAGVYSFTDVPIGTFTVAAADPVTQFQVRRSVTVAQDQTAPADLTLLAVGTIQLTAHFNNGVAVSGALVQIQRSTSLNFDFAGRTDTAGRLTISTVPEGPFVVRVSRPDQFDIFVDAPGRVATPGQIVPLDAVMTPIGTLQIQVNSITGAPVEGSRIATDARYAGYLESPFGNTDANGRLTIPSVAGGRIITVQAFDPVRIYDYRQKFVQVVTEGEAVPVTIVLGAVGSVTGRVSYASGAPAGGVSMTLRSESPPAGLAVNTDAQGGYRLDDVPPGPFRITAIDYSAQVGGAFEGQIVDHGDQVAADIVLSRRMPPAELSDANGYHYRINQDLSLGGFTFDQAYANSPQLQVTQNDGFSGDFAAEADMGGRQLSMRNYGGGGRVREIRVGGLFVTRKIYVPTSGYFARYLEILENRSGAPITVDVQLRPRMWAARIGATSSGGAALSPSDQWFVTEGSQSQPLAAAEVYAGPGGVPSFTEAFGGGFDLSATLRWGAVTVAPGGRAIFLHFTAQQADPSAAVATAARLVQLPAEALVGLSAADAADIRNFTVPADLSSTAEPLLEVRGRVFASDRVTPVAGAEVLVTGNLSPVFKPTVTVVTDADGRYATATLGGAGFTVQARYTATGALSAVATGSVAPGQMSATQDVVFETTGVLSGTVRRNNGSAAGAGAVTVTGGDPAFSLTVPAASDGTYIIAALPPGTFEVRATVNGQLSVAATALVVQGQTTVADLRMPAAATLRLRVLRADGTAQTSAYAYITDAAGYRFAGYVDAAGVLLIPGVVEGAYVLQVEGDRSTSVSGSVTATDDGSVIEVLVQSAAASVSGHVTAADGLTPVTGAYVQVIDGGSGAAADATYTDGAGFYQFADVLVAGGAPFRVVAHAPSAFGTTVESAGQVAGAPVVVDLSFPLTSVHGRVRQADGVTPLGFARITVAQAGADGAVVTLTGTADGNGDYSVFGVAAVPFEVRAVDRSSSLEAIVSGDVPSLAASPAADVRLGATGVVAGTVRDAAGQPLPYADVALSSNHLGLFQDQYVTAGADGSYRFPLAPVGAVSVQGCARVASTYVCAGQTGSIAAAGATTVVDLQARALGTVAGTVFAADGVTPVAGAFLQAASGEEGPNGDARSSTTADAAGAYSFAGVVEGPVAIQAYDPSSYAPLGAATGVLGGGGPLRLDVTAGNGVGPCAFPVLNGADGFLYGLGCEGALEGGGAADGHLAGSYGRVAQIVRINGTQPSQLAPGQHELADRQIAFGPQARAGVVTTRQVFVPASGGFARFLDTVTNPGAAAVALDVQIESNLAGVTRIVVDPESTGRTYAVTTSDPVVSGGSSQSRAALAHVFGGAGAAVGVDAAHIQHLLGSSYWRYTVTIGAGESVSLMHFAVQREPADAAGAQAQAEALVNLTDPQALTGMSAADKARVVNFRIP